MYVSMYVCMYAYTYIYYVKTNVCWLIHFIAEISCTYFLEVVLFLLSSYSAPIKHIFQISEHTSNN